MTYPFKLLRFQGHLFIFGRDNIRLSPWMTVKIHREDLVLRWLDVHREHLSTNEAIMLILMEVPWH